MSDIQLPSQRVFTNIRGQSVTVQAMPASRGLFYFAKIIKIMKGMTKGIGDTISFDWKKTNINFGEAINGILSNIDPQELVDISKGLLQESLVVPTYTDQWFDKEFSGNYDELVKYIENVLMVNYSTAIENFKKKITLLIQPSP